MNQKKQWPEELIRSLLTHIYILCLAPGLIALWVSFSARHEGHVFSAELLVYYLAAACLFMLMLTLAITPVSRALDQPNLAIIRRPLGLAAFAYAFAQWLAIFWLYEFNGTAVYMAFSLNPSLWAALFALLLMVPMVLTASHQSMHNLGIWWRRIHSAIYVVAIFWIYYMVSSFDVMIGDRILFSLVSLLLIWRVYAYYSMRREVAKQLDEIKPKDRDEK
jgi:sulfoxide reductase heme-binding subunit YedZ